MSRFRKAGGFTMVELLVALAVFATVMAGISVVFISSLRAWRTGQESRSVFQMARAATQFMERDITSAFGSVDRGELQTLVGARDWLTFVGITENPQTGPYDPPKAHSDVSRISYYLAPDLTGSENFLLIRLVSIDKDGLVDVYPDDRQATTRSYFEFLRDNADEFSELAAGAPVIESDFELASNILDMKFHYGTVTSTGGILWADSEPTVPDGIDNDRDGEIDEIDEPDGVDGDEDGLIDEAGDGIDNDGNGRVDEHDEGWNAAFTGSLPEVIYVHLGVRAAARMPTDDTMQRVFHSTIFLPLGYRRPMPAALR